MQNGSWSKQFGNSAVFGIPFLSLPRQAVEFSKKGQEMNLDIINLEPVQWDKATWNEAYDQYCKSNMFGVKSKREFYDMVVENFHKLEERRKPLSKELSDKWLAGWRNAVAYAKKHKCNQYGQDLESCKPQVDINELADDVKELQWRALNK